MVKTIDISVRNLIEFVLRSGSISSGYFSTRRANEGTFAHGRLQKRRKKEAKLDGAVYESECVLKTSYQYKEYLFHIDGRADGIVKKLQDNGLTCITIEEIKSTTQQNITRPDKNHRHWAQAKFYAFMYCCLFHADESSSVSPEEENGDHESLTTINTDRITIRLTYCSTDEFSSDSTNFSYIESFDEILTLDELKSFVDHVLNLYYKYAEMDSERIEQRKATASACEFPYGAYRGGQRELAVSVFASIKQGKKLFTQAPTGIGKTISTIFPSVKAAGMGLVDRIFYLTSKTITRQVAEDALALMKSRGLMLRAVTITAKEKICFQDKMVCEPDACVYADGHFDRINEAVYDLAVNETNITRSTIERYAQKHRVCPYELSHDATLFCDAIICDYNYMYDPNVQLRQFFGDNKYKNQRNEKQNYIALHDEAHNLVERAREMYSAQITDSEFKKLLKMAGKSHKLYEPIKNLVSGYKSYIKELSGLALNSSESAQKSYCTKDKPKNLLELLFRFKIAADNWMYENSRDHDKNNMDNQTIFDLGIELGDFHDQVSDHLFDSDDIEDSDESDLIGNEASDTVIEKGDESDGQSFTDVLLDAFFHTTAFLRVAEQFDEHYAVFITFADKKSGRFGRDNAIKLLCLDPSYLLSSVQNNLRSCVFFSATLTPLDYFANTLGGFSVNHNTMFMDEPYTDNDFTLRLPSPFPRENLNLIIDASISTKYKDRENSYQSIADDINVVVSSKRGNYLVFFSSYVYLQKVYELYSACYGAENIILQEQKMSEEGREKFLACFAVDGCITGFVVLGGLFAEGIDLAGDRLIGAVVVGVGLPLLTAERDEISRYYNSENGNGYNFAYVYPGMNKVMQAAGRVIRSSEDRGVVLLIEKRFAADEYRRLMPSEWDNHILIRRKDNDILKKCINNFWNGQQIVKQL